MTEYAKLRLESPLGQRKRRSPRGGFRYEPLADDYSQTETPEAEICTLSPAQLRDMNAEIATVISTEPDTNYIALKIGNAVATAYCTYAQCLSRGDELYILRGEIGKQQKIRILGLRDRPKKEIDNG